MNSVSRTWYLPGICEALTWAQNRQREHITRQSKLARSGFSQNH